MFTTIGHHCDPTGRLLPLVVSWSFNKGILHQGLAYKQWKPNASKNKSWLWHHRLNHLNFGTLNDLARKDLVRGLPQLKFEKDHLCSACQLRKSRKATHKPKTINTITEVLHTLHMDLCGPLRVQSINGKKYILVIVDDYSRFTWVKFLRSKDETLAFVINLLKQLQVGLNKTVRFVRTDNGTEFVNKDLTDYYESVGITHEKTVPRTPQQNGVVERRNRTLVEAARTMLIFSKAPFEDLGKLKAKADIGFFVGYAPNRKGYRIYNKRTRQIMETIHVTFDELTEQTAPVHSIRTAAPNLLTLDTLSVKGSYPILLLQLLMYLLPKKELEFCPASSQAPVNPTGPSVSIPIDQEAPSGSHSPSSSDHQSSSVHQVTSLTLPWWSNKTDEDLSGIPVEPTQYAVVIGSLLSHSQSITDLVFAVTIKMVFGIQKTTAMLHNSAYADADHAVVKDTRISTSGKPSVSLVIKYSTGVDIVSPKALPKIHSNIILPRLGMKSMKPETLQRLQDDKDGTLSGVVTNDMYQPWRALATIINLCLTGKTSAFERPRALVLQILWGVVNKIEFVDEGVPADEPRVHVLPQNRTLLVIVETSSLYAELGLTVSETDFDEEVSPETNVEAQEEGQGGTNPGNVVVSQTPSSHVVHAGPNLDHMDLGIAEASSHGANLTPSKG
ncbi:retrovirus-related pol polyprotein from transposon TNT 1-94 [Tanacetum coccineum]